MLFANWQKLQDKRKKKKNHCSGPVSWELIISGVRWLTFSFVWTNKKKIIDFVF